VTTLTILSTTTTATDVVVASVETDTTTTSTDVEVTTVATTTSIDVDATATSYTTTSTDFESSYTTTTTVTDVLATETDFTTTAIFHTTSTVAIQETTTTTTSDVAVATVTDCSSAEPTYALQISPSNVQGQYLFISSAESFEVADAAPSIFDPDSFFLYNQLAGTLSNFLGDVMATNQVGFSVANFESTTYQQSTGATPIGVTVSGNNLLLNDARFSIFGYCLDLEGGVLVVAKAAANLPADDCTTITIHVISQCTPAPMVRRRDRLRWFRKLYRN
jgi:hypothetical protein